ncbi:MAG: hypothetical protein LUF92_00320 [Clostridiales bacterium]|nr:hypothetical protein [Clostridiales bacterium]
MSLLGNIAKKAVVKTIKKEAEYGFISHVENTRSVDALINKSTANYMLFIKKKSLSIKRGFTVYDELDNKKYIVKTDSLTFGYPCIRLYGTDNHEIGNVELTSKEGMGTYTMALDGKVLGTLRRKMSLKVKLELSFNNWKLEGNFMQNTFTVTDKSGNVVIKFDDAFSYRDTYVLEINNREHEIIGLLLVMAVELALHGND